MLLENNSFWLETVENGVVSVIIPFCGCFITPFSADFGPLEIFNCLLLDFSMKLGRSS